MGAAFWLVLTNLHRFRASVSHAKPLSGPLRLTWHQYPLIFDQVGASHEIKELREWKNNNNDN